MDGFINYLKPPGMTSSDAVLSIRRLLPRGTRVGHGGTLDPDAAGVLPICIGGATRLFDILIDKEKTYLAELCLGVTTDTQDATGRALDMRPTDGIDEAAVRAALPAFTGDIEQIPPDYSAVKRDGHRLYELARKGEHVEVSPRKATIFALDYLGARDYNRHMLRIVCGRGVYIRTLLHDIGQKLGCGGHMAFLLREACGAFHLAEATPPAALADADAIAGRLLPLDMPLARLPRLDLPEAERERARNGNPVPNVQGHESGATVRVYVGDEFAGIGCVDGACVRFRAMLLPR